MSCETCYEVQIPECPSSILVKAGLIPSTIYYVRIIDKFGEVYRQQVTSDINGSINLDLSGLPDGALNRHSGNWIIEVRKVLANCAPELMQFCCDGIAKTYSCIIMSFFQSSLGSLPTDIGCICNDPIEPSEPGEDTAQSFPFTNVSSVTCVHDLGRYVDVTIYNSLGVEIEGQIEQPDLNTVVVTFNSNQTGTVLID